MSLSIDRIREKFRQEIRSKQIQQYKKIYRARAIKQCQQPNIFIKLQKKILANAKLGTSMQIIQELASLLDSHPEQQNTYILITNYLVDHSDAYKYFIVRLLSLSQIAQSLQSYKSALLICLIKADELQGTILQDYDDTISQIIRQSTSLSQIRDGINMLNIVLSLQNVQKQKFEPRKSITQFFLKLRFINLNQLKGDDIKYFIVETAFKIGMDHIGSQEIMKKFIPEFMMVAVCGIQQYAKFREGFIASFKILVQSYCWEIEHLFKTSFGNTLIFVLLYIYTQVPRERISILTILELIIRQFQFNIILKFLNSKLHLALAANMLELPIDTLRQCLAVLLALLNRLQENRQTEIVQIVLTEMQQQHRFDTVIEELFYMRHDQATQKILRTIIDSYYSDSVQNELLIK